MTTTTIQIRRHNSGGAAAPVSLLSGEAAYDAIGDILYIGRGDNGSGVATSVKSVGGAGAFVLASLIGAASGVASLDATGKLPLSQLPAAIAGAMVYQGTWNASTNAPALASGVGTKGYFYKVGTAGATTIDGLSQWNAGDIIAFDGTTWDKIDGVASEVLSVAGRVGAIVLTSADLTDASAVGKAILTAASAKAARLAITLDGLVNVADANKAQGASDLNVQYTSLTAARTVSLATAASFNPGTIIRVGDVSGACSSTNTITLARSGSDTINGGSSTAITTAYGQIALQSDGVSAFTIVAQPAGAPASIDGGTF